MWIAVCLAAAAPSKCSEARAVTWIRPSVGPPKGTDLERSARDSDVTGSVTLREQAAVQRERDIGLERWHRAGTVLRQLPQVGRPGRQRGRDLQTGVRVRGARRIVPTTEKLVGRVATLSPGCSVLLPSKYWRNTSRTCL